MKWSSRFELAPQTCPYLEVVCGELQHVPQDVTDDLGLSLQDHTLIIQRLNDLRLHLQRKEIR